MALTTETKRVVGQYEYTDKDVNQGVTEFLRQMRKPIFNEVKEFNRC